MLWAGRIISWVLIVTGGLTWTVGQAGLDSTDKNLCELASKVWQGSIDGCHIIPALVAFWKIGSLAALIFLIVDGYHWLKNRTPSAKRRPLFQDREISLTETLLRMTEQSALGRWQCAQSPESTREIRLRLAASFVRTTALNGQIAVRGRQRKSVNYKMIDRDFWHSAYIAVEHDSASICKPVILAMGDVTIPDYDGLIIERESVEALWPRYEWKYIWRTLLLSAKAKLKAKGIPERCPWIPLPLALAFRDPFLFPRCRHHAARPYLISDSHLTLPSAQVLFVFQCARWPFLDSPNCENSVEMYTSSA